MDTTLYAELIQRLAMAQDFADGKNDHDLANKFYQTRQKVLAAMQVPDNLHNARRDGMATMRHLAAFCCMRMVAKHPEYGQFLVFVAHEIQEIPLEPPQTTTAGAMKDAGR